MDISYRKAGLSDLNTIEVLVGNAIQEMNHHNINQWDNIYPVREDFENDIRKNTLCVGIIEGKIAVVFAINQLSDEAYDNGKWAHPDKSYYVVHRLCVNPVHQNMGVARNAMEYIIEALKAMGIEAIRLDVYAENPFAIKLYKGMGFTEVGEVNWRKGKFLLMEKYLED